MKSTIPRTASRFNLFNCFNQFNLLTCAFASIYFLSPVRAQSPAKKTVAPLQDEAKSAMPISVPVNQVLTPAGVQVELPGLRPQVIALSPDGKLLVTSGKTPELIVIDPSTGK